MSRGIRGPEAVRGYTVVELLVALLAAGIVGGSVVSLLVSQQRFHRRHADLLRAQEIVASVAGFAGGEFRLSAPADLIAATPESVAVRFDAYRAVVCRADPGSGRAWLFVFDTATNANLRGTLGYAVQVPGESSYRYADGWRPVVELDAGARDECTGRGAPDRPEGWRYRILSGWESAGPVGIPPRGAVVRKYGRLTYRFSPSRFEDGPALRRNGQELLAPFAGDASFLYILADGDTVAAPGTLEDVRAVVVHAAVPGDHGAGSGGAPLASYAIWLRNVR